MSVFNLSKYLPGVFTRNVPVGPVDVGVYVAALVLTLYSFRVSPEGAAWVASPVGLGAVLAITLCALFWCKAITGVFVVYIAYQIVVLCLEAAPIAPYQGQGHIAHLDVDPMSPLTSTKSLTQASGTRSYDADPLRPPGAPKNIRNPNVFFAHTLEEAVITAQSPLGVGPESDIDPPVAWRPVAAVSTQGASALV